MILKVCGYFLKAENLFSASFSKKLAISSFFITNLFDISSKSFSLPNFCHF